MRVTGKLTLAVLAVAIIALLGYGVLTQQSGNRQAVETGFAAGKRITAPSLALPALANTGLDRSREDSPAKDVTGQRPASFGDKKVGASHPTIALSAYRGKVVVVNLWASWCQPCTEELPILERVHQIIKPRNGLVLGIATTDTTADALGALRKAKITYPALRDPDGRAYTSLKATGIPETFVVDRRGKIAAMRKGAVTRTWLVKAVEPLLKEKA